MSIGTKIYNRTFSLRHRLRHWHACLQGGEIASTALLEDSVQIMRGMHNGKPGAVCIGSHCTIATGAVFHAYGGRIELAEHVFIGPHVVLYGHGDIRIGKNSLIAMHTSIIAAEHALPDCSTAIRSQPDIRRPVTIGEDVWVGAGVRILAGVTIGDGCVIGAGSVVRESIEPGSIVAGVPARVIRMRS